jgi:hypothetical protein
VALAVATSAPPKNIVFTLDELDLRRHFAAVVGAADVKQGKPHPDVFLKAAEKLGAESRRLHRVRRRADGRGSGAPRRHARGGDHDHPARRSLRRVRQRDRRSWATTTNCPSTRCWPFSEPILDNKDLI